MNVDGLYDAANEYLEFVLAALAATDEGAPETSFIGSGVPALDCPPMCVVWAAGPEEAFVSPGSPPLVSGQRNRYGSVFLVALVATFVRCVPTVGDDGQPPATDEQETAAKQTMQDVWAVWNHLHEQRRIGALFPPLEREVLFEPSVVMSPSGGAAGWNVTARVQLDGFAPIAGT